MKRLLTAVAVIVALTSLAWAQTTISPTFGEPGTLTAMIRYGSKMLADPVFLGVVVVSLLIVSRFFYWPLVPLGGGAGVIGAIASHAVLDNYSSYDLSTKPFWGTAVVLGIALGLATVLAMQLFGKKE